MKARLNGKSRFLWVDEEPERRRDVRQGEILVSPVAGNGRKTVPYGLIHDWIGAAFIPNATIQDVFAVVQDYEHYKDYYRPTVIDSKLLGHNSDESKFRMRWLKKVLFVTAVIDAEYVSHDFLVDDGHRYGSAWSTQIQEIQNYGQPGERRLAPDTGSGYIWRLYSISRCEQRDGGVYVELEATVLSREVPSYVRWLVNPIVSRLSRNSLLTSLEQTREAVRLRKNQATRARPTRTLSGSR